MNWWRKNISHLAAHTLHLLPYGMLFRVTSKTPASIPFTKSVKTVNQAEELAKHDCALEAWATALVFLLSL